MSKRGSNTQPQTGRLLNTLLYIQTHLDTPLPLEKLAAQAGLSDFHFHRIFRATIGETVRQYVERLRLEQAAYRLKLCDDPIIDIGFGLGYNSHEIFSRAFRRYFGMTPQFYRHQNRPATQNQVAQIDTASAPQLLNRYATHFELSKVTICHLESIPVAFIRHLGGYTEIDTSSFGRLITWAKQNGLYHDSNLLIGVGHDDPTITPMEKVRFDACLQIPTIPMDHPALDEEIGFQRLPGGIYAMISYVGAYGATMEHAYHALFHSIQSLTNYTMIGLPALEIYRTTQINPDYELNHTDIYLPIAKKGG